MNCSRPCHRITRRCRTWWRPTTRAGSVSRPWAGCRCAIPPTTSGAWPRRPAGRRATTGRAGCLPRRPPPTAPPNDIGGGAPAPGWQARYDWTGWLPAAQTPRDDGAKGWVATANQRVTAPDYPHYLTQDWVLPYRHQRIEQLIEAREKHDIASMQAMQHDVTSLATRRLLPYLRQARSPHPLAAPVQALLANFDAVMDADQAAPLVFAAWADELTRGLIEPRIGQARFAATYGKRDYRAALEGILERNDGWWCQPMSCAEQSSAALTRAL